MHPKEPSQFNLTVIAKICSLGVPYAAVSIGLLGPISSIATLQIKVWRVAPSHWQHFPGNICEE